MQFVNFGTPDHGPTCPEEGVKLCLCIEFSKLSAYDSSIIEFKNFFERIFQTNLSKVREGAQERAASVGDHLRQSFTNCCSSLHPNQRRKSDMKRTDWWSSCICLRGAEAPKIEHFPEDAPTLVQIQPPPSLPLGDKLDPEELQQKVTELLDELDLTVSQKNGILNFPPEKQLQLLYSHTMQSSSQKLERPEAYIAKLQEFASLRQPADEYQFTSWLKYTNGLKTALATHSNTFIGEFVEAGGLASLLSFLEAMDESSKEGSMHTNLVACVKALMNNSKNI
ncbi:hypothetical protein Anas_00141 [Armadillidium nasatum]|uniref:Formin GTPase-binding domain-containing protein n=1 Tax=Armadillidium nasatum TaxID=96803 RepID=A0A5N5SUA9_9CRUS|nr:hypothetical protein Anas_00141 [Armadillidium nasatum]